MSSLSQRLKNLQVPGEVAKHDFSHLSLQELEETKVDFGQAHVGRTYREMWQEYQDWLLWFSNRYEKSGKESHQKILHYVQMKVKRAELAGTHIPVHKGVPATMPVTKAKAKPMPKKITTEALTVWDAEEEDEFEIFPEGVETAMSVADPEPSSQNVAHLEVRMLSMENAVSQILMMLENFQPAAERQ